MKINYKLTNIKETSYYFNFGYDYRSVEPNKLRFYFSHRLIPGSDKDTVTVLVDVSIIYGEEQIQLASNAIAAVFSVQPMENVLVFREDGLVDTPNQDIVDNMAQIAVGILRGVLYKNLKGTPLEAYPLPLISPSFLRQES